MTISKHSLVLRTAIRRAASMSMLALLAACGSGGGSSAPAPLASGTFTKTVLPAGGGGNSWPITANDDIKHQTLYYANEVNGAGYIKALRVQLGLGIMTNVTCPNTTIKLGHTAVTALSASFASNAENGRGSLSTVMDNATLTLPAKATGSWIDIPLATPFLYNGFENLVVEITRTSKCSGGAVLSGGAAATLRRAVSIVPDTTTAVGDFPASGLDSLATGSVNDAMQLAMGFVFAGGENLAVAGGSLGAGMAYRPSAPAATGRAQFLVQASDIKGSGPVTGIRFTPMGGAMLSAMSGSYKVTLSHLPAATTQLGSSSFASNVGSSATVVANGVTVNLPVGTVEWWVPFNGSFNYDGTSNLLIDVEATVTGSFSGIDYKHVSANQHLAAATTTAATGTLYAYALEPKLRFHGAPLQAMPAPAVAQVAMDGFVLGSGSAAQIQSLYRNDFVGTSGAIQNVYVRLAATGTAPTAATLANYKLYMGHTTKSAYALGDTYTSNMSENALVMSGALTIPAGLKVGDWVKIPLNVPFAYDSTRNLSILFTTDASPTPGNAVSMRVDGNQLASHSLLHGNNAATNTGAAAASTGGIIELMIELAK